MIRGLTDAAQRLGSHPFYSHCWDWDWAQQPSTLLTHSLLRKQENGQRKRNVSSTDRLPTLLYSTITNPWSSLLRFIVWGQRSGTVWTPLLPFSPAENGFSGSFEKLSTVQLTCSEGALFPIHGNEECAINWAPQGGSAQQRGRGRRKETLQCCKLRRTIYATQAWASLEETWCLYGNWVIAVARTRI